MHEHPRTDVHPRHADEAEATAAAAGDLWCDGENVCYIRLSSPPSDPSGPVDSNGWTPGAPICYYENSQSGLLQLGYTEDDQIAARKRRGSRGGRPPGFDANAYRGRNVIE